MATTAGSRPVAARRLKIASWPTNSRPWWRPTPTAWGSTSGTFVSFCITTCRARPRRFIRNSVAPAGRYRLMRPDMTRDELARTGQSYRDRQERDLRKHQEIVGYAEGRACRWQTLLGYFGGEGLPDERCGHCDHCKRWALLGGTRA